MQWRLVEAGRQAKAKGAALERCEATIARLREEHAKLPARICEHELERDKARPALSEADEAVAKVHAEIAQGPAASGARAALAPAGQPSLEAAALTACQAFTPALTRSRSHFWIRIHAHEILPQLDGQVHIRGISVLTRALREAILATTAPAEFSAM